MSRRTGRRSNRSLFAEHPQVLVVLAVFFTVMVIYMAALIDLQAVRPERYRDLAADQSITSRKIAGFRGQLVDREGYVLAASTPTQVIIADPQVVSDNDPEWTASLLAPILQTDAATIAEQLLPSFEGDRYNEVATTSDQNVLSQIRALVDDDATTKAFAGIVIRPEEDRLYPAGSLARPLIGRVDADEVGRSGLEQQFDELLRGTAGREQYERGVFGSISVGQRTVEPAAKGYDITLTIDHRVQYGTESILKDTCEKLGAAGASAIVANPATGETYAMASVERIDQTHCGIAPYNKAAIDTFEPGSVMKLVAFAAAADALGYTADDRLVVPGSIKVADKPFFDHPRHDEMEMTMAQALGQSSNVAAITLAQQMGSDTYYDYARRFGFGSNTGLDLAGESAGILREPSEWLGSDAGSIVIGQGMTVNLMQLSAAFNTVGNGGLYIQPSIVKAVKDADGGEAETIDTPSRQIISSEAAAETIRMLQAVTAEGGTGVKASIDGYSVAGKTGTAWKVFDNGSGKLTYGTENDRRYITTFGGLVPAESPEISVVLVIDEPRTATSATTAAAPAFAEIAQYALRVLNIAPAESADDEPLWRANRALIRGTPAAATDSPRAPEGVVATPVPVAGGDAEALDALSQPSVDQPLEVAPPEVLGNDIPTVIAVDLADDPSEGQGRGG